MADPNWPGCQFRVTASFPPEAPAECVSLVRDCTQPDASSRPTCHQIVKRLYGVRPPSEPEPSAQGARALEDDESGLCIVS